MDLCDVGALNRWHLVTLYLTYFRLVCVRRGIERHWWRAVSWMIQYIARQAALGKGNTASVGGPEPGDSTDIRAASGAECCRATIDESSRVAGGT